MSSAYSNPRIEVSKDDSSSARSPTIKINEDGGNIKSSIGTGPAKASTTSTLAPFPSFSTSSLPSHRQHRHTHSTPDPSLVPPGHKRNKSSTGSNGTIYTFQQQVSTTFKNLPDCACGKFVHERQCPRFAMRIRFENGIVVGVCGDGDDDDDGYGYPTETKEQEESIEEDEGEELMVKIPKRVVSFSEKVEYEERSPQTTLIESNATLALDNGQVYEAQVEQDFSEIVLNVDGKTVLFRPV